jgi:hypothetical protein
MDEFKELAVEAGVVVVGVLAATGIMAGGKALVGWIKKPKVSK